MRPWILCGLWLLGATFSAIVRAEPVRELTFIEVRTDATERSRTILRKHAAALNQHASRPRALVLEETARPEKFVLLESAEGAADGSRQNTPPLTEQLSALLTAPPDHRTHREFGDPAASQANAGKSTSLFVITHLDLAPPERAKGEAALARLVTEARRSAGNLLFAVWQQTDRANHFNLVAVWSSRKSFDDFAAGAAAREFRASVASLLGSPYDERLYRRAE